MYTGAPVASASAATPPMWSKWVCVIRIAATAMPSGGSTSYPGSITTTPADEGSARTT
jgi:hypothetical protein